jgi:IclR family acetate operon transcriptional repressor
MATGEPKRPRGRPRSHQPTAEVGLVQALDRGLQVLKALSVVGSANLTDLSLATKLPASTTHRILATLQHHGFVMFDQNTQRWAVGIEAFRTGSTFLLRTNLLEAAIDTMRDLMEQTGETANLAIADNGDVVFIGQVETTNPIRAFFQPGTRSYMHASGIGKALLASMRRSQVEKIIEQKGLPAFTDQSIVTAEQLFEDLALTRTRGWAFDDEERFDGMRCVAAGIYNSYGDMIAGISISGPAVRLGDDVVSEYGSQVRQAADRVTEAIGGKLESR